MSGNQFGGAMMITAGIFIAVYAALTLLFLLLLASSVYDDAKARSISNPRLFHALAFVGGIAGAIAYACVRNKQARTETPDAALVKKAKTKLVWACIFFGLAVCSMIAYLLGVVGLAITAAM